MAIRTYATSERFIPANFNTYSLNNGLKWIDTQRTTTATFLRSDAFTTEFDAYRIVIDGWTPSVADNLLMRMRTAGGAYSAANYYWSWNGVVWASAAAITGNGNAVTSIQLTSGFASRQHSVVIELDNVRTSAKPSLQFMSIDTTNACNRIGGGWLNNTADYVGVEVFCNVAMSGTMSIYGYRKP